MWMRPEFPNAFSWNWTRFSPYSNVFLRNVTLCLAVSFLRRFLCFYFYFVSFVMLHRTNIQYNVCNHKICVIFVALFEEAHARKLSNKLNCKKGCNHFIIFSTFVPKALEEFFKNCKMPFPITGLNKILSLNWVICFALLFCISTKFYCILAPFLP